MGIEPGVAVESAEVKTLAAAGIEHHVAGGGCDHFPQSQGADARLHPDRGDAAGLR